MPEPRLRTLAKDIVSTPHKEDERRSAICPLIVTPGLLEPSDKFTRPLQETDPPTTIEPLMSRTEGRDSETTTPNDGRMETLPPTERRETNEMFD